MCATWKLSLRKHSVKLVPCTDYSWQQTSFSMFRSLSSFSFLKWLKWRCDDLLGFISIIWILWVSAETINIYITRWIHNETNHYSPAVEKTDFLLWNVTWLISNGILCRSSSWIKTLWSNLLIESVSRCLNQSGVNRKRLHTLCLIGSSNNQLLNCADQ